MNIFDFPQNDYLYLLSMAGDDIYINNGTIPKKALINNLPVNRQADIRTIATKEEIKRGDLINWDNEYWLIISDIGHKRYSYYKGIIQKCNYNIKFNFQGIIKEFPAIIDSKVFDVEEGKYFSMPEGKIIVYIKGNADTNNIEVGQRFIKMGSAWKIAGIDKTKNGMIILHCDLDSIDDTDDMENEIANKGDYTYTLTIENGESAQVNQEQTLQLNVSVKLNGKLVEDKEVAYVSSDTNIAIVDENGFVTTISAGQVVITAYMVDYPAICDTITILVEEVMEHNYTITITGSNTIQKGKSATYTANIFDNGVLVDDKVLIWQLINIDGTTNEYVSIINQTNTTITLQAGQTMGKYVKVIATLEDDDTVFAEKIVQIRGLF